MQMDDQIDGAKSELKLMGAVMPSDQVEFNPLEDKAGENSNNTLDKTNMG